MKTDILQNRKWEYTWLKPRIDKKKKKLKKIYEYILVYLVRLAHHSVRKTNVKNKIHCVCACITWYKCVESIRVAHKMCACVRFKSQKGQNSNNWNTPIVTDTTLLAFSVCFSPPSPSLSLPFLTPSALGFLFSFRFTVHLVLPLDKRMMDE